ncbi:MAG: hypothetical protein QOK19_1071 [Solirubrobacteraceae bacterium]|nr:hypothetical protein [Solirubrobacterales bacterium]MEA2215510.1 hypothetical protein [Solirubrobacteraceae bacterium]
MLLGILITVLVMTGLGAALRGNGALIGRTPYNNRYNDASASREDHLG